MRVTLEDWLMAGDKLERYAREIATGPMKIEDGWDIEAAVKKIKPILERMVIDIAADLARSLAEDPRMGPKDS